MRFVRILLITLCIVVVLLVVGVGLLLTKVDLDRYRGEITEFVEQATGRHCQIDGEIQRQGIIRPQITVKGIHLGNIEGASEADMLFVEQARANVDLVALLRGTIVVQSLEIDGVRLVLERGRDNAANWVFKKRDKDKARAWIRPAFLLSEITVKRFTFVRKMRNNRAFVIDLDEALMKYNRLTDSMQITADGRIGDAPTSARGSVSQVRNLASGERAPSRFDLTSEDAVGSMEGYFVAPSTGSPSRFDLKLENATTETVGRMLALPMPVIKQVSGTATLEILRSEVALTDVELDARQPAFSGHVSGAVGDMKRLAEIDLELDTTDADLLSVFPYLQRYLPGGIRVAGAMSFSGDRKNLLGHDIDASFRLNDVTANARGSVDNLRWGRGFNLTVEAVANSFTSVEPLVSKMPALADSAFPALGPINGSARLIGEYRSLGLVELNLILDDPRVNGVITGRVSDLVAPKGVALAIDTASDDLNYFEQLFDVRFPEVGDVRAIATLTDEQESWLLTVDRATLRATGLSADLHGTVSDLQALSGVDMAISANVDDLTRLNGLFGKQIPALENGFLEGRLIGGRDDLSLAVELVSIEDERVKVQGTGQVTGLGVDSELDLMLAASSDDVAGLAAMFEKSIPQLGSVVANGRLLRQQRQYRLEQIEASTVADEFQATVSGTIADLSSLSGMELVVAAKAESVAGLPVTVTSLPEDFGPLVATATIAGSAAELSAQDLTINVDQESMNVEIKGQIADLSSPQDGDFQVNLKLDDLAALNELSGQQLPSIGPVVADAYVSGRDSNWQLTDLALTISDSVVEATVAGQVNDLASLSGVELEVDINAQSLKMLGNRLGMKLDLDLPVNGTVRLSPQEGGFALTDIDLNFANSKIGGDLLLQGFVAAKPGEPASRRSISGELVSDRLDLKPALPEPTAKKDKSDPAKRIFSDKPFAVEQFSRYDIDVGVKVNTLETHKFLVTGINSRVQLNNSVLRLKQENVGVLGGIVAVDLRFDAAAEASSLDLQLTAQGIDPAEMPSKKLASIVSRGFVNLTLDLAGNGNSLAQLMGNTNGEVELETFNLLVDARALELVGSDITLQVLRAVNPFLEKEENVEFQCGLFQADITDGMLLSRNTIAAQSQRISVVGGGVVDLGSEQLELVVSPKPRKGIGISAANLARVVRVGGTLAAPKLEVDPGAVLLNGAKVGAAIYTGGLTLFAEGLLNRLRGLDNVCDGVRTELKIRSGEIEPLSPIDDRR